MSILLTTVYVTDGVFSHENGRSGGICTHGEPTLMALTGFQDRRRFVYSRTLRKQINLVLPGVTPIKTGVWGRSRTDTDLFECR